MEETAETQVHIAADEPGVNLQIQNCDVED
jgi:hypothetical protein